MLKGWVIVCASFAYIGFLFAIATFMLAYNGKERHEMIMSKVAAFAALGVALFPCECHMDPSAIRVHYVHGTSAAVMFLVLAGFCYVFYRRALEKQFTEARRRAGVYAVCGVVMICAIATLAANHFFNDAISRKFHQLVFFGELAGLLAFGVSWLTAARVLPGLTRSDERLHLFDNK